MPIVTMDATKHPELFAVLTEKLANRKAVKDLSVYFHAGRDNYVYLNGMRKHEELCGGGPDFVAATVRDSFFIFKGTPDSLREEVAKIVVRPPTPTPRRVLVKMTLARVKMLFEFVDNARSQIASWEAQRDEYVRTDRLPSWFMGTRPTHLEVLTKPDGVPEPKDDIIKWIDSHEVTQVAAASDRGAIRDFLAREDITQEILDVARKLHLAHQVMSE